MMSIVQHNSQKTEQCNQEDLGKTSVIKTTLPVILIVSTKWQSISLVLRGRNRNFCLKTCIVRTAGRQLDRHHLLFGVKGLFSTANFAVLNNPLTPKLANQHEQLKMNLTLEEVSMF